VAPVFDISQDIEQDCDSGDVSQPVDVSQTGDNSIQTVGVQPTANTGCAQNATGILQAAPIVAGLGGDTLLNNDDNGDNGDVFRNIGNDRFDINGADFGDTEVDSNASIDLSPNQVVEGGGTINQTAIAKG
jgi:hypothetical protein